MTVADLLAASRDAHLEYRRRLTSPMADLLTPLQRAHDTRTEAHELDPDHTDPAWQADSATHGELMRYFERQLNRRSLR